MNEKYLGSMVERPSGEKNWENDTRVLSEVFAKNLWANHREDLFDMLYLMSEDAKN